MTHIRKSMAVTMIVVVLAGFLVHWVGLEFMAEVGIVEQLLSAGGADGLLLVLIALSFIMLRLAVIFLGPGILLVSLGVLLWPKKSTTEGPSKV